MSTLVCYICDGRYLEEKCAIDFFPFNYAFWQNNKISNDFQIN